MRTFFALFFICLLAACTSPKKAAMQLAAQRPAWLQAAPSDQAYYVGIGHSLKSGDINYVQAAKKSALDDIISSIKVTVQTTSVLSKFDADDSFREQYEQIIQTTANDELEEFEHVDSWEDDLHYWTYYRLSKSRYKEIKEEKKRKAVALGLDFFTKARQAEKKDEFVSALNFYYQGFKAVEKYLGEPIRLEFEGKEVLLINEIIGHLQQLLDKATLTVSPAEMELNRRMAKNDVVITVSAIDHTTGKVIDNLPLKATFEKGSGHVFPYYETNDGGKARVLVKTITSIDYEQQIAVEINPTAFTGNRESEIYALIGGQLSVPKATVLFKVSRPLVYIEAQESVLGKKNGTSVISDLISDFLTRSGFEITRNRQQSELVMNVQANTEKGSQSGSVYATYLTVMLQVTTLPEEKEIYVTRINKVKGYSLNYERSSEQAYNEGIQKIKQEKLSELLDAILQ